MHGSCRTMGLKTQCAASACAACCMSHRTALRWPSHRTASPRQTAATGNRRATEPSVHHPRQTAAPRSAPKQGAPIEALHRSIPKQEPRCLIRSTAVFYFKKNVPGSAPARFPHRNPALGTSTRWSPRPILPHSPSGRSTTSAPKCRFRHQDEVQFPTRNTAFAIRAQRVLQGEQALCLTPPGTKG